MLSIKRRTDNVNVLIYTLSLFIIIDRCVSWFYVSVSYSCLMTYVGIICFPIQVIVVCVPKCQIKPMTSYKLDWLAPNYSAGTTIVLVDNYRNTIDHAFNTWLSLNINTRSTNVCASITRKTLHIYFPISVRLRRCSFWCMNWHRLNHWFQLKYIIVR